MNDPRPEPAPKVHPASREMLPEDPLQMTAFEVPGDTDLMLRLLVEEYARMGWDRQQIMQLARDPHYTGFHGLFQLLGAAELQRRIAEILSRCGVIRVQTRQPPEDAQELVQLQKPTT